MKNKTIKLKDGYSAIVLKVKTSTLNEVLEANAKSENFNQVYHEKIGDVLVPTRLFEDNQKGKRKFLQATLNQTLSDLIAREDRKEKIAALEVKNRIADFENSVEDLDD